MTPPETEIPEALMDKSVALLAMPPRPLRAPGRGPLATARKYSKIFRASLVERMAYRGDFLLGTILRFLPMVTTILLWRAVFEGSGKSSLAGFTYDEMIAGCCSSSAAATSTAFPTP
jgi:ABC-2 type transport system permease protein